MVKTIEHKKNLLSIPWSPKWNRWIIFVLPILLYANTAGHDYTQDDAIVIYDNMYTTQGVKGIPGLLTKDTFYGFFKKEGKGKLVAGGRYRPLTPVMFAIEYELFGKNPLAGHLINILLYGILCYLVYLMLLYLLKDKYSDERGYYLMAFLAALIFAAHPVHTEVVANIKGRDEIMSMMGSVVALIFALKYFDTTKKSFLWGVFTAMFLGLMSKENAITYFAVIPLAMYVFRDVTLKKIFPVILTMLMSIVLFLSIRFSILGADFGGTPMELMNNPFLKIEGGRYLPFSFVEKMATIAYIMGKYLLLLIFPHPLTHDYYPRHIDMMTLGDWQVLLSMVVYIGLVIFAFKNIRKKNIVAFAILYFLLTISIVSNIIFPIGTNMSERFLFMPSLGFALVIVYLFVRWNKSLVYKIILPLMVLGYTAKTITRNRVWKDDFTLFTTDVKTSSNSAKVLNAAGGVLISKYYNMQGQKDINLLDKAIPYLEKALKIHPNYKNASLLLGNAYFYKKEYEKAIHYYEHCLKIAPDYQDARRNLGVALRDAGRQAGEIEHDMDKALKYLLRSLEIDDSDFETLKYLGITYGIMGNHKKAIGYFEKVTKMTPNDPTAYSNLAKAYSEYGDEEAARIAMQTALQLEKGQ